MLRNSQDRSFLPNYQKATRQTLGLQDPGSQFAGRDPSLYNQEEGFMLRVDFIENLPVSIKSVRLYISFFQKGDQSIKCNWSQQYKTEEESYRSRRCLPRYRSRFAVPPNPDVYLYLEAWGFPSEVMLQLKPTTQGWTTIQIFDNYGSLIPGKFHLPFYKVGQTDPNQLFVMKSQFLDGSFINVRLSLPKDPMLDFETTIFNANEYRVPAMHAQPNFVKWGDNNYTTALQQMQQFRPALEDMKNKNKSDRVQVIKHASEIFEPVERLPQDLDQDNEDDDEDDEDEYDEEGNAKNSYRQKKNIDPDISLKMNDKGKGKNKNNKDNKNKNISESKRDIFLAPTMKSQQKINNPNLDDDDEVNEDSDEEGNNNDKKKNQNNAENDSENDDSNEDEDDENDEKGKKNSKKKEGDEIYVEINHITFMKYKGSIVKYKIELLKSENDIEISQLQSLPLSSLALIKDKNDQDCLKEGTLSIEEAFPSCNITIFEHQDAFSTEESLLIQKKAGLTNKNGFLKISIFEEKVTANIGFVLFPLLSQQQQNNNSFRLVQGTFEEMLLKPEKSVNTPTPMSLNFSIFQKKSLSLQKFDQKAGVNIHCKTLSNYTAKPELKINLIICKNAAIYSNPAQGDMEDEFIEDEAEEVFPDNSTKTVHFEDKYSLDFPFNHERINLQNRNSLNQYYLIISVVKLDSVVKSTELGWIAHPLYRRKLFNSGSYSTQLLKPPMKMIPPQQILKDGIKKVEFVLDYSIEESQIDPLQQNSKIPNPSIKVPPDNGLGLFVELLQLSGEGLAPNNNEQVEFTISLLPDEHQQQVFAKDRTKQECTQTDIAYVESREKGIWTFEHQSFFNVSNSTLLTQYQQFSNNMGIGIPKFLLSIILQNQTKKQPFGIVQRAIFSSKTELINGVFTEPVFIYTAPTQAEKSVNNSPQPSKFNLKFLVYQKPPVSPGQFSSTSSSNSNNNGISISLHQILNCTISQQQKISASIYINDQHNNLHRQIIKTDCSLSKGSKILQFPEQEYSEITLPFQHEKHLALQRNRLADCCLYIQFVFSSEDNASANNNQYGWVCHPIFKNRKLNEGRFSIQLCKPPAVLNSQLILPQGGVPALKKIDAKTVLEFTLARQDPNKQKKSASLKKNNKNDVAVSDDDDEEAKSEDSPADEDQIANNLVNPAKNNNEDDDDFKQLNKKSQAPPKSTLPPKDELLWVEVNELSGLQLTSQNTSFSYTVELFMEKENSVIQSNTPIKDKKNKPCRSEGPLSIENSEILLNLKQSKETTPIVFEHASVFDVEDNYLNNLLNQQSSNNSNRYVILIRITVTKEKPNKTVIGTIEHTLLQSGDSSMTSSKKSKNKCNIGPSFDSQIFQKGGTTSISGSKPMLNYSVFLKKQKNPENQEQNQPDEGVGVYCMKMLKYKEVEPLKIKISILSNGQPNEEDDAEIEDLYEPKQGMIDFQDDAGGFFSYFYSQKLEENRNKLNQFALIIQFFQKKTNSEEEVEFGWVFHPLFRKKQLNIGVFTLPVFKAPAKLQAPLEVVAYQKLDTMLEFQVTDKDLAGNDNASSKNNNKKSNKPQGTKIVIQIKEIRNVEEPLGFGFLMMDKENYMENDSGQLAANEIEARELEQKGKKNSVIVYDQVLDLGLDYSNLIQKYDGRLEEVAIFFKFQNNDKQAKYWFVRNLFENGKFKEGEFEEKLFLPPLQDPLKINMKKIKFSNAILVFSCKIE